MDAAPLDIATVRPEQGIQDLFNSDRFKEYLRVMSKFHIYSFNSTLLIVMQKPDATFVAGYTSWKEDYGRQVVSIVYSDTETYRVRSRKAEETVRGRICRACVPAC